jgi:hypothetical protein
MAIAIFFLISWLTCCFFAVIKKPLSIIENTFIFMLILVININYSWIIIEEFKRITLTTNGLDYTAYLLHRSIITPMLATILVNLVWRKKDIAMTIMYFGSILAFSFGLSLLSEYFRITRYTKWDFRFDILYFFVLYLITYYALKLFKRVNHNEVRRHDPI